MTDHEIDKRQDERTNDDVQNTTKNRTQQRNPKIQQTLFCSLLVW